MKRTQNQRGYTLLESIMFIAVITVVSIGIVKVINSMLDRYKISRLTSQVTELQKMINVRFAASENYRKLHHSLIHDEKLYPGDINWDGSKMLHKYGGEIDVRPVLSGRAYDITFKQLPKTACVELAIQNWAHDQSSNLIYMKVNDYKNVWRKGANDNPKVKIMPISVVEAEDECSSELNNEIIWRFQ